MSGFKRDFVASSETKVSMLDYTVKKVEENRNVNVRAVREFDDGYGVLSPSCLVNYRRRYFSNGKVRMTIHSDLTYSLLSKDGVYGARRDHSWIQIVEFRFSAEHVKNEILEVSHYLPRSFPNTKEQSTFCTEMVIRLINSNVRSCYERPDDAVTIFDIIR